MTRAPLSLLLSEEWPDGTFGGARPVPDAPAAPTRTPDPDAAAHVAVLEAAVHRRQPGRSAA
ncbi:hypothetical protein ACFXKG_18335 [Streptomyces sp. NPDC059255]|uniref:hypothetical protein n=1 Tax=Streptomyces sp. NPDC059255 TaxID=3346793 RepID=UPI003686E277